MDPEYGTALSAAMPERLRRALPPVIGLALFAAGLAVLRHELHAETWRTLTRDVLDTPLLPLGLAVLLTAANYAVMTGYDFLAFAYIGKRLSSVRIALASFVAYAVANNVGFAMLSGASVRYRFYTRWGVTTEELSRIVFSYALTFWLGLFLLGGLSLAVSSLPDALAFPGHEIVRPFGWLLVAASLAYVAATVVRREPFRFRRFELSLPTPRLAVAQLAISALDWLLAAAVLYVLLPPSRLSFLALSGAFIVSQLLGLTSHVPGGVGVFEGSMVVFLGPFLGPAQVVSALVVYRVVYYLLPLAVTLLVLVADELHQRRAQAARMSELLGRMTEQLAPRVLAFFTFLSGVVLLFSGATPAAAERLRVLDQLLPLGVIEVSHFLGSVLGAALLVLSHGLARRLDAAYHLTLAAIALGIVALLFKGVRYEEALVLAVVLLVLARARPAFDRRTRFFDTRFSPGWILAIVGAFGASVWLGSFAYKHVEYSNELWWQFELHGGVSRFLRGSVGAAVFLALFAFAKLIAPAPHAFAEPTADELEAAASIIDRQASTLPNLVFLRDKSVLFDEGRSGFVMYAVQGRTWVALGDPVGPPERTSDLIRLFLEQCDDFDGVPTFYEVRKDQLHHYADFGMTFVKLGEEARVDLTAFSLDGGRARGYRRALQRLERERVAFRILAREDVATTIDELRAVSDDWLEHKAGSEKGFSLGFFDPAYLSRFPLAVAEREGRVLAFANLLPGPQHVDLTTDLMRYRRDAPSEVMEGVLLHLMLWGKAQGYSWFSLGMAPLSGFEQSPVAPLWSRLGSFVYRHGEAFYHFQGLRAYKEKFHPYWEPRYLVYPGGFRLPRILADIAALIAGGYRNVLLK